MEFTGIKMMSGGTIHATNIRVTHNKTLRSENPSTVDIESPGVPLDDSVFDEDYLTKLQAKVAAKIAEIKDSDEDYPETEFFRRSLGKFLHWTTLPNEVAFILFDIGVLKQKHLDKIRDEPSDYEKNNIIYNIVTRVDNGIVHLITALHKTGNYSLLKLIDDIASS